MIGVVIPAYNVGVNLSNLLLDLNVANIGPIFVVDDCSAVPICSQFFDAPNIEILRHNENKGYSKSVMRGMQRAFEVGCNAAMTIDGDGAHRVTDALSLAQHWGAVNRISLLIGDRMNSWSFRHITTKRIANLLSSYLVSKTFGSPITDRKDVSSGLRIYSQQLYEILKNKNSEKYGLCYSSIYWSLAKDLRIEWLPIEVWYAPTEFCFTKRNEFLDLLSQLQILNIFDFDYTILNESVKTLQSFNITFDNKIYFSLYMEQFDGYFFRRQLRIISGFPTFDISKI